MKFQIRRPLISTIVDPYSLIFQISETFAQIFDSLKIRNVSNFYFEKRTVKETEIFHIFKGLLFLNGSRINVECYECWRVLRDFHALSKKCGFAIFSEI